MTPNPFAAQAMAAKLILYGLGFSLIFGAGCTVQKRIDATAIVQKNAALTAAATALRASGDAIAQINAEAAKREAAAAKQAAESRAAEKMAMEANANSAKRALAFEKRLSAAGKSKPDCASLLALDLEKVCGVKSR